MGCFSSKEPEAEAGPSKRVYNEALDGPPDFGLGDLYEVRATSRVQRPESIVIRDLF